MRAMAACCPPSSAVATGHSKQPQIQVMLLKNVRTDELLRAAVINSTNYADVEEGGEQVCTLVLQRVVAAGRAFGCCSIATPALQRSVPCAAVL